MDSNVISEFPENYNRLLFEIMKISDKYKQNEINHNIFNNNKSKIQRKNIQSKTINKTYSHNKIKCKNEFSIDKITEILNNNNTKEIKRDIKTIENGEELNIPKISITNKIISLSNKDKVNDNKKINDNNGNKNTILSLDESIFNEIDKKYKQDVNINTNKKYFKIIGIYLLKKVTRKKSVKKIRRIF
ncbi:hypothetical protein LY90DRAFT_276727 [Neocallimastix californiae]|uniref:Uncharacterized protein n=1 Tax=Neocallimastix californiae TaxID=1754190 RepID=A0A1Y2D5M0_9FUNG|nr:hypothetical protein LY90DRAFT_276727 [Neocallimastix californiae]|eukprot:ORY54444.1 hypothetical protein LY90DRAFT_276727 [Neocallimastix californiae]